MPRGRSARATRSSRLPQVIEMEGTLLEAYNHIDDLPRLSAEPKKRPRHVTRGSVAAERKAAAAATLTTLVASSSPPRVTRRNRAAASAAAASAAAAAIAAAHAKRIPDPSKVRASKLCCRVCLRPNSSLKIIRCSVCRKGVHTFCLNPPIMHLPAFGSWKCYKCKRKAIALKREKRTILRDALVTYPTLCTDSFVHKIIHAAASVDVAALARQQSPTLTTNHVHMSQPNTHNLANGRATARTSPSPIASHSHHFSEPLHSLPHHQTVRAAIPFTRARLSAHHPSSLPAPLTDATVVVRVPKELHLDNFDLDSPPLPQPSSRVSPCAPSSTQPPQPPNHKTIVKALRSHPSASRPIPTHKRGITKPPTVRRSQPSTAPKKRVLRTDFDANIAPAPFTADAPKRKHNESSKRAQPLKRSRQQPKLAPTSPANSAPIHHAAKACSQSAANARSHLDKQSAAASAPAVARQMESATLVHDAPTSRPRLLEIHTKCLPLQKRYKYIAQQTESQNAQPTPVPHNAHKHVGHSSAPDRESDKRANKVASAPEIVKEANLGTVGQPSRPSATTSIPLNAISTSEPGAAKPLNAPDPSTALEQAFAGTSTPKFVNREAVQSATAQMRVKSTLDHFLAPTRNETSSTTPNHESINVRTDSSRDAPNRMVTSRKLGEPVTPVTFNSFPEVPESPLERVDSAPIQDAVPMRLNAEIPSNAVDNAGRTMASGSPTGTVSGPNIQNARNRAAPHGVHAKNLVKPTKDASITEIQWDAKREALMAFAQVQRKLQAAGTPTVARSGRRVDSQMVRQVSRNQNVPETERHRMEITALATSSRFRYAHGIPEDASAVPKGSIRSLLQTTADFPPNQERILDANTRMNRSHRASNTRSYVNPMNYDPESDFDLHQFSEDGQVAEGRNRRTQNQQVVTGSPRIYDNGRIGIYPSNSASFKGVNGRPPASRMTISERAGQVNASYHAESLSRKMYEARSGSPNTHQKPPGVEAGSFGEGQYPQEQGVISSASLGDRQASSPSYRMSSVANSGNKRNGSVPRDAYNRRHQSKNRQQGRQEQRLPSASNLQLPRPENRGLILYQQFGSIPSHVRLPPVSFASNGRSSGASSRSGAPILEPMEMPAYGRPGDPIRYNDLPPTTYRRAAGPALIPPNHASGTRNANQRKPRAYVGRGVSNVDDVHATMDGRQMASNREVFGRGDYLTNPKQENELGVKSRSNGVINLSPMQERRTLRNATTSVSRPRRLTTPYVQPETRRAQFEQGKALAFVGTSQSGQGMNGRRFSDSGDMRSERGQRERVSNFSDTAELGIPGLNYSNDYHSRRSRMQGSSSVGNVDFLGTGMNMNPQLGSLPDAGLSLSKQIRALVSQTPTKTPATPRVQVDALQLANGARMGSPKSASTQPSPQSNAAKEVHTSTAAPAVSAAHMTKQPSKNSDVMASTAQGGNSAGSNKGEDEK